MRDPALELSRLVEGELAEAPPPEATRFAEEIRRRLGSGLAAVVFYGSCMRRGVAEGVLDFYALVDGYADVYDSRLLAAANALLPPNVFYLELEGPTGTARAKYAVMSLRDFERATAPRGIRSSTWARFCQPALAVYARDEQARGLVARACAQSVLTAMGQLLPLLPAVAAGRAFEAEEFWRLAFRETYRNEMRPESDATIRELYQAAPERYHRAASAALAVLAARGDLTLEHREGRLFVRLPERRRRAAARAWRLRRPLAKLVYVAGLLKTAFTFGDWLPYALWKLERHTGTRVVPTERQRRHPLIWGWPVLMRVLWRRDLR